MKKKTMAKIKTSCSSGAGRSQTDHSQLMIVITSTIEDGKSQRYRARTSVGLLEMKRILADDVYEEERNYISAGQTEKNDRKGSHQRKLKSTVNKTEKYKYTT